MAGKVMLMYKLEPCHTLQLTLTCDLTAAWLLTGREDKQVTQEGSLPHTSVFAFAVFFLWDV